MSKTDKHRERGGKRRQDNRIAAAWFVRMRSPGKTPEDEYRFRAWLEEDERHAAQYAGIRKTWDKASRLAVLPAVQAMWREALQRHPRLRRRILPGRDRLAALLHPAVVGGLAAVLVVAAMGAGLATFLAGPGRHSYQTAAGVQSEIRLADGSHVTLMSDSRVMAAFSDHARRLILLKGGAYFDVAHDPHRPFRVEAGSGTVTALGTEFDVYKSNGEVIVTLIDGSVEVAAPDQPHSDDRALRRLKAGERISYGEMGIGEVREVEIARAISWRRGRMIVTNEPLLNVIDEMNRRSKRKLKVDRSDRRLRRLLVTGQFKTGRPELIVEYIRAAGIPVWVTRDSQGNITLRLRGTAGHG